MCGKVIIKIIFLGIFYRGVYTINSPDNKVQCKGKTLTVYESIKLNYTESEQICGSFAAILHTANPYGPLIYSDFFQGCPYMPKNGTSIWISKKYPEKEDCYVLESNGQEVVQVPTPCHTKATTVCIECGDAPIDPNADITYTDGSIPGTPKIPVYTCHPGYTYGSSMSRNSTCLSNGKWYAIRRCRTIECYMPLSIDNGFSDRNDSGPFFFNHTMTYQCNPGFDISNPIIRCLENETWSQPGPVCTEKVLPDKAALSSGNDQIHSKQVYRIKIKVVSGKIVSCS